MKTRIVFVSAGPLSSTPAAPGAANTSTFFIHCLGRAVRHSPWIITAVRGRP